MIEENPPWEIDIHNIGRRYDRALKKLKKIEELFIKTKRVNSKIT
jgi:hypothetical protein